MRHRGIFAPIVLPLTCGLVDCVGDDPSASAPSGADASTSGDSGSGTNDSGGSADSAAPEDSGVPTGDGGDAATDADAGKGLLTWSPSHWGQSSPFPGTGTFVSLDALGNTYLGFTFNRATTIRATNIANTGGVADIAIVKLDTNGAVAWTKVYGGSGDETLEGMTVDNGGNVYLVGKYASSSIQFGAKTLTKVATTSDAFVAKLDSNGTAAAAFDLSTSGATNDKCTHISFRAGSVLIGCTLFGSATVEMQNDTTKTLPAIAGGANAVFALLRDSDLKAAWVNSVGGSAGDSITGLTFNNDGSGVGSVAYVGVRYNSGPIADSNASISNVGGSGSAGNLVARINLSSGDLDGTGAWNITIDDDGGTTNFFFVRAMTTIGSAVVLGGELGGTMTLGGASIASSGMRDAAVVAYGTVSGAGAWARRYGDSASNEGVFALTADSSNQVFAAMQYGTNAVTVDGATAPAGASNASVAVFQVLSTANASVSPFLRPVKALQQDAGITTTQAASLACNASVLVLGGGYRGTVDLGNGTASPSFDPLNNGWDAYAVSYNR